ncbi:nuclear transport factor 2 family protein [Actinopolymorpha singaporensis]|uniref:SnoaL-like domain-containing protein n=1 Tax=Actinopolymorpha singaporensis TaxID=117157 RepID=A0A1H1XRY7_9ACTN|nr:nuclear transport factor 2 family protein [Actinopolymorpha singaporensis]SDT11985.1 SnoaL-like domain-containing protein [Actinopolymorpha singaporensis]
MTDTTTNPAHPTKPPHPANAVERYVEFWNAAAPEDQQRLAAQTFAAGVSSRTPVAVMRGVEELVAFRDQFAQHFPDYRFQAREVPETHHERARLRWEIVVGGTTFATGTDVLHLDDAGRITEVTGFLDQPPEGFGHHDHD